MADKTLNVRIQLRHDLEANWLAVGDTLVPLAGEACVTMDGENKGRFHDLLNVETAFSDVCCGIYFELVAVIDILC